MCPGPCTLLLEMYAKDLIKKYPRLFTTAFFTREKKRKKFKFRRLLKYMEEYIIH